MWPFKRKVRADIPGDYDRFDHCAFCKWTCSAPRWGRKICPDCGRETAQAVGRWIYQSRNEGWATSPRVRIRFEVLK